ncbi:hypothetical protein FIV41_27875 [Pseudomonas marginalis]|uniref:Transposase n=1 Tax=Pseudomonas marginalis TaxID=298 RepID=A0A9X9BMU0_PSEMA|nr:hypothetical protein FIV41_27875 [Pseudomonas marginalis]
MHIESFSMDMRADAKTALAKVIAVFGAAKLHCAYLLANRRAIRMKCRCMTASGSSGRLGV